VNIAIIGAGFAGLATAWHLLTNSSIKITIFDAKGIGGGASGIAAGLLHPYAGVHSKLNQLGRVGMEAALDLIKVASQALQQPVISNQGILRLALTQEQKIDFAECAQKNADVQWLNSHECQTLFPALTKEPGIWIKEGCAINSALYLQGLWQACQNKGAGLEKITVSSLQQLDNFDVIIVAAGAHALVFPELASYSFSTIKGQILELKWPQELPPLPFVLNSHAYLVMQSPTRCLVGATFERKYQTEAPDLQTAQEEIMPKAIALIPGLQSAKIMGCQAGVRLVTPSRSPLVERIGKKHWVITGLGSKGLLYHAYYAKQLADQVLKES
jgi:glycine/D-amino acid oxidase-like deaminating enzyme